MINKRSIYTTCLACKRKINEISQQKSLKCKKCEQRQEECKRDVSVQLLVPLDDKDVWLTAFADGLESVMVLHPGLKLLLI